MEQRRTFNRRSPGRKSPKLYLDRQAVLHRLAAVDMTANRLMVLVLAAGLSMPRSPTTTRIVGSSANRSASLVSS